MNERFLVDTDEWINFLNKREDGKKMCLLSVGNSG